VGSAVKICIARSPGTLAVSLSLKIVPWICEKDVSAPWLLFGSSYWRYCTLQPSFFPFPSTRLAIAFSPSVGARTAQNQKSITAVLLRLLSGRWLWTPCDTKMSMQSLSSHLLRSRENRYCSARVRTIGMDVKEDGWRYDRTTYEARKLTDTMND
jgi:hypothetical protein